MKTRERMSVLSSTILRQASVIRTLFVRAGAVALCSCAAFTQSSTSSIAGGAPGDGFGSSIDRYVDINSDGYVDMIVGSPGVLGSGRVSIVSGKYIATGAAPAILWSVQAPVPGSRFGWSVANLGDVTGDGIADIAVGAPIPTGNPVLHSYLYLVSGASHAIVAARAEIGNLERFGWAVASAGDFDGDGVNDIAVGDPFGSGHVQVVSSAQLLAGAANPVVFTFLTQGTNGGFGSSLSRGDLDGDGKPEWAIGAPRANHLDGAIYVFNGVNHGVLATIDGTGLEQLGTSASMKFDVTNDGTIDLVAGAPNFDGAGSERGEVIVYSGARILAAAAPFDIRHWYGSADGEHFGSSVAATADLNGDFLHDVVVGSPDYGSIFSLDSGRVSMFSGLNGASMGAFFGAPGEHLGAAVADAWAYDLIFGFEFAAGAPQSDANNIDSGLMRIITLFPSLPAGYCTGKLNSQACTPAIAFSGSPSKTSLSSFLIQAANLLNNKPGLLLYGLNAAASPFQGGTLCVASPIKRVGVQSTGGNPPPNDCSGTLSFDFNAQIRSGIDPALIQGRQVFAQYWSRDPASPGGSSLSNALRFLINP